MVLTVKEALSTLGIKDVADHPPKMKFIQKRFYQLSLIHHPDRPGGDNLIQQKIAEAFKFIGDYIINNYTNIDDAEEESARDVYKSFDFSNIKENIYSFTIKIDNNLSHLWDAVLSKHYGPPVDRKTNGKHWKHLDYTDDDSNTGVISIGKWHIPKKDKQSKINIQSNTSGNILPAHFVSNHYPKLLEEVNAMAAAGSLSMDNSSSKLKCEICDHQAKTQSQLKTHMKRSHRNVPGSQIHTDSLRDPSNRRPKFVIHPPMNVLPSTPITLKCEVCDSIFYKEDYLKEHMNTIHKYTYKHNQKQQVSMIQEDVPCFLCGKTFADPSEATSHIQTYHEIQCKNCDLILYDQYDLQLHIHSAHKALLSATPQQSCNEVVNDDIEMVLETLTDKAAFLELERKVFSIILDVFAGSVDNIENNSVSRCTEELCGSGCDFCKFKTTSNYQSKMHLISNDLSCDSCQFVTKKSSILVDHIASHHPPETLPSDTSTVLLVCDRCEFVTTHQNEFSEHMENTHVNNILHCTVCTYTSYNCEDLNDHMNTNHTMVSCDQCNFTSNSSLQLSLHVCNHVDMVGISSSFPSDTCPSSPHTQSNFSHHSEENLDIFQALKSLQEFMTSQFSEICSSQEKLRADVQNREYNSILMRTSLTAIDEKQEQLAMKFNSFLPPLSSKAQNSSSQQKSNEVLPHDHPIDPACPLDSPNDTPAPVERTRHTLPSLRPSRPPTPPASPPSSSKPRLPTSKREKVLFISDSIGTKADKRHLEEATNTLIYEEKAYGAQYKHNAWNPHMNFCDVAPRVACKRDYKYAVLQGGSSDISDLDTSTASPANIAFFEQEVFISSQNMISAAESILSVNPAIETVVIMERTPRFDPPALDPCKLKPELSKYANQVLRDQLQTSYLKDRIVIGTHCLPQQLSTNVLGHPTNRFYDGVHLNGPDGPNYLTRSLCNVLQRILTKNARSLHHHTIPITRNHESPFEEAAPTHNPSPPQKPDMVVIDIDLDSPDYQLPYTYSVPTSNFFNLLGN